jgi:hypothetical protein
MEHSLGCPSLKRYHQGAEAAATYHMTQPISPKLHIPYIPNSKIPNAKRRKDKEQKSYKSSRPREPRKRKSGMGGRRNRPISRVPRVREGPEN